MTLPVYTFSLWLHPTAPELEIQYSIEPADPSVGIAGGAFDCWTCFDAYGRELFPEYFTDLTTKAINAAIHADFAARIEDNRADIAAHAFDTKD